MQYIWQHGLWNPAEVTTVDGRPLRIIDRGWLNSDSGPDFFNAKVEIGGRVWAGNIEFHVRASDWLRHGHDGDPAYDSVVLHVVARDDCRVSRTNGELIPQIVMACAPEFYSRVQNLLSASPDGPVCAERIRATPTIYLTDWLISLVHARLQRKADRVKEIVGQYGGSWHDAVYITLARALGFGTNSDAFERLARLVPLKILLRHALMPDSLLGLLFGVAGLIPSPGSECEDDKSVSDYAATLRREYEFMSRKFGIEQPRSPLGWKMARMRPQNFPHRRIAMLAAMMQDSFRLAADMMSVTTAEEAEALFGRQLSGFWATHYSFSPSASGAAAGRVLGKQALKSLIINVVVPVQYAYSECFGDERLRERAVEMLEQTAPEDNTFTRMFTSAGLPCRNALESQAIVELRRNYCEPRKCLYCRIGHRLLARK